ncbi:hypothetical protein [Gimesia aquarii]|uniref:Uncharacterized protein n=1 Tax=Gimesia aquarii TaxID=2527964 RepID=A0A517VXX0_9PLAN|nr:hypothetical protein [Gimesia aquarii]QDT97845.1 hypothetical protein V144x_33280 [Gimesia aquarii]
MTEEHLRQLRFIHRTYLGICAATLVFAVAPQVPDTHELLAARADVKDLIYFLSMSRDPSRDTAKALAQIDHHHKIRSELGLPFAMAKLVPEESLNVLKYKLSTCYMTDILIESKADTIFGDAEESIFAGTDISKKNQKLLFALQEENIKLSQYQDKIQKIANEEIQFSRLSESMTIGKEIIQFTNRNKHHPRPVKMTINILSRKVIFPDKILESNDLKIFSRKSNAQIYWEDIKTLTPSAALLWIDRKLSGKSRSISVLGLSINEDSAKLAAPLLILGVLFGFISHLSNAVKLVERVGEIDDNFPWIALFSDNSSKFLTFASTSVFPVIALSWLLSRSFVDNSSITFWCSVVVICVVFLTSLRACYLIRQLSICLQTLHR